MKAKIELKQTDSRAIFAAYRDGKYIGEFRGYGKTPEDVEASALAQAESAK